MRAPRRSGCAWRRPSPHAQGSRFLSVIATEYQCRVAYLRRRSAQWAPPRLSGTNVASRPGSRSSSPALCNYYRVRVPPQVADPRVTSSRPFGSPCSRCDRPSTTNTSSLLATRGRPPAPCCEDKFGERIFARHLDSLARNHRRPQPSGSNRWNACWPRCQEHARLCLSIRLFSVSTSPDARRWRAAASGLAAVAPPTWRAGPHRLRFLSDRSRHLRTRLMLFMIRS